MKVLVATCSHRGDDARIVQRQAAALVSAGHDVVLVAPTPRQHDPIEHVVVRRAVGRRRLRSWLEVTRAVRSRRDGADVLLVHDLELLVPLMFVRRLPPLVVDIHEDLAASIGDRAWLPRPLRAVAAGTVRLLERRAGRTGTVIAAEHSYRTRLGDVAVVPNSTPVPPTLVRRVETDPRIVYVGRISRSRGWDTMVAAARRLAGTATLHLWGEPDADVRDEVTAAAEAGDVVWHGYTENPVALAAIEGAAVGLSLLRDLPNYRTSMPTKIAEYMARAIPVVATSLPESRRLVEESGAGFLVEPDDVDAVVARVIEIVSDPGLCVRLGDRGREYALARLDWTRDSREFVGLVAAAARAGLR